MNHKETLNNLGLSPLTEPEHIYESETRAEEISQDIHNAFSDGSLFGEMIANSVGEALSKAIDKSGLDAYINDNINNLKSSITDSILGSMNSDEFPTSGFVKEFADLIAQKEVDRELQNLPEAPLEDKELEQ